MARHAKPGRFESAFTRSAEALRSLRAKVAYNVGALAGKEAVIPGGHLTMKEAVARDQRPALIGSVITGNEQYVQPVPAPERPAPAATEKKVQPEFLQTYDHLWPTDGKVEAGVPIPGGGGAFGIRVPEFRMPERDDDRFALQAPDPTKAYIPAPAIVGGEFHDVPEQQWGGAPGIEAATPVDPRVAPMVPPEGSLIGVSMAPPTSAIPFNHQRFPSGR